MQHATPLLLAIMLIGPGCRMQPAADRPEQLSGQTFLEHAAAEHGVVHTASGAVWKEVRHGTGASPRSGETVTIQYQAALQDGTPLDTNIAQVPITLVFDDLPRCWTEGLERLRVGGAGRIVCPAQLALRQPDAVSPLPRDAAIVLNLQLIDVGQALPARGH